MIYTLDLDRWYELQHALELAERPFVLHYADDESTVGIEFEHDQDLTWFILEYDS